MPVVYTRVSEPADWKSIKTAYGAITSKLSDAGTPEQKVAAIEYCRQRLTEDEASVNAGNMPEVAPKAVEPEDWKSIKTAYENITNKLSVAGTKAQKLAAIDYCRRRLSEDDLLVANGQMPAMPWPSTATSGTPTQ